MLFEVKLYPVPLTVQVTRHRVISVKVMYAVGAYAGTLMADFVISLSLHFSTYDLNETEDVQDQRK